LMPASGGTCPRSRSGVVAGIVSLRHANGDAAPETQMLSH
jgi:hypothetical protein